MSNGSAAKEIRGCGPIGTGRVATDLSLSDGPFSAGTGTDGNARIPACGGGVPRGYFVQSEFSGSACPPGFLAREVSQRPRIGARTPASGAPDEAPHNRAPAVGRTSGKRGLCFVCTQSGFSGQDGGDAAASGIADRSNWLAALRH